MARRTPQTSFPKVKAKNATKPPQLADGTQLPSPAFVRLPDGREGPVAYCRPCRPDEDASVDGWRAIVQVPGSVGVVIAPSLLLLTQRREAAPDEQERPLGTAGTTSAV